MEHRAWMEKTEKKKYTRDLILVGIVLLAALLLFFMVRNNQEKATGGGAEAVDLPRTPEISSTQIKSDLNKSGK